MIDKLQMSATMNVTTSRVLGEAPTQMFSTSMSLPRMPFEGREDTYWNGASMTWK